MGGGLLRLPLARVAGNCQLPENSTGRALSTCSIMAIRAWLALSTSFELVLMRVVLPRVAPTGMSLHTTSPPRSSPETSEVGRSHHVPVPAL